MSRELNRRIVLARRPDGMPVDDDFRLEEAPVPEPREGELLIQARWLSIDPYVRGLLNDSETPSEWMTPIGGVVDAGTVGEVVASRDASFGLGDIVVAYGGWQDYAICKAVDARRIDPKRAPVQAALGVLGMTGLTAYGGLLTIGKPATGETVVVAAATGAVGSVVGQLARIHGARAVGIAGGPEKCRALIEEFGFDAAVDRRSGTFRADLAQACSAGINVYFENVGGPVIEAVLPLLARGARIPVCGFIAHYNRDLPPTGQDSLALFYDVLIDRGVTATGFLVNEFEGLRSKFEADMSRWIAEDRIRYREDVLDGLENCPRALRRVLSGRNFGKMLVRLKERAFRPSARQPEL